MANFPFRINIVDNSGHKVAYYTSSLVTDADTAVSSSDMVNKILLMPSASFETLASGSTDGQLGETNYNPLKVFSNYNTTGHFNYHLSASVTGPHTGSVVFHDRESSNGGGLAYYEFYGTKVCSVLGLPEGIRIRPENFRLSDSSTDTTNYLSGDIISNGVQIKESLKLSTQARVRSNLIWDEGFGEGFIQFVSGSLVQASFGFDGTTYSTFTNQITGSRIKATNGFIGNLTGNVTGNVTGNSSTADVLNYIGDHGTLQTFGDPALTAPQLVFSGSQSNTGNGGDIVLKAGNNVVGNTYSADVKGGDIVLEPGGAAVLGLTAPGVTTTGSIHLKGNISGSVIPNLSATFDLGSTSRRWQNVYTTDLQLSNMDRKEGNVVDGTKGNWTLQEGEEDLFVINNITGKKYKIALIPQDE